MPIWSGHNSAFKPFNDWERNESLKWYQAYNNSKHDRQTNFKQANFENLLLSVTGLFALLSSQFRTESFAPGGTGLGVTTDSYYSGDFGMGDLFMIQFPENWTLDEQYDFNWSELKKEAIRFNKIDYNRMNQEES